MKDEFKPIPDFPGYAMNVSGNIIKYAHTLINYKTNGKSRETSQEVYYGNRKKACLVKIDVKTGNKSQQWITTSRIIDRLFSHEINATKYISPEIYIGLSPEKKSQFVRELITNTLPNNRIINELCADMCFRYRVYMPDIYSKSRKREVVRIRQLLMFIAYKRLGLSTIRVGKMFSRDHATTIHACKTVAATLEMPNADPEFHELLKYGLNKYKKLREKDIRNYYE